MPTVALGAGEQVVDEFLQAVPANVCTSQVTSYLTVLRVGEVPKAGVILTAMYWDTLRKIDGTWLLHRRLCNADPQPEHSTRSTDVLVNARDQAVAA